VEAERRATLIVIFSGDPDFVEMLYHRFNGWQPPESEWQQ
jgi:hypothetical protein